MITKLFFGKWKRSSKKSHTLLDQNPLEAASKNVAGKSDWDSSALLAGQETLANFVLQLFLYFRLDNGIALMFSLKQPLSLGNLPGGPVVRTLHSHC